MDLENLTKHQIILLTLLVSFVTSMATGIVTVSLMNQAPPSVSRTINQIVERTVQTVAPSTQQNTVAVTTQKTIVVKDDDLVAQTIASIQKSIIRITAKGSDDLLARGVVIGSRDALTDKAALENSGATEFEAILPSGARVPLVVHSTKATSSPLIQVTVNSTSSSLSPSHMADPTKLRLGQSVLRVSGKGVDSVSEGVVSMLPGSTGIIEASIQSTTPGSVLVTRFGDVIGITTASSLLVGPDMYTIVVAPVQDPKATNEPKTPSKP